MFYWTTFISVTLLLTSLVEGVRPKRHMMDRPPPKGVLDAPRYPLCSVGGIEAACLANYECQSQRGRFAGYCSDPDLVCCVVEKTCWATTTSPSVIFRNPSYPDADEEARLCPLTVRLGRDVCAVRVEMEVLELAKYEDDVCIRDTLTFLGSTEGIATPVCGNMTGYSTTFAVRPSGEVTVSLVAQAKHRFSITLTQLGCGSVLRFLSPSYSGVRNDDAQKYFPPPTTAKPAFSVKLRNVTSIRDADGETTTETYTETPTGEVTEGDLEEGTTEYPGREVDIGDEWPRDSNEQTALPIGKYPSGTTTPTPEVIIRALPVSPEEEVEVKLENEVDAVYTETPDVTPAISVFRRAFELRVQDKCWMYEEEDEPSTLRVVGGFNTNLHEYPWQVALVYKKKFFCGGSLISDRFVLTAAHCVFGSFSKGLHEVRVSLGDHDLSTKNDTKNEVVGVRRIIWHLHYSPHTNVNDIALFELASPVNFTYNISAIKLPHDVEDTFVGQNATVTGWGRYSIKTKKTSSILKEYTAPVVDSEKCAKAWKKFPSVTAYADKHLCLDVKMGTPCHGDSGGPLVACTGNSCTQIGLVSFGFPLCTNVGLPAVFTKLTHYRSWLDRNLAVPEARPV